MESCGMEPNKRAARGRAAGHAAKKSLSAGFLSKLYRLCALVGLKSAACLKTLGRAFRPSKAGKKGLLMSLVNYGGPVVTAAALVLTVAFWSAQSFGIEVQYEGETLGYIAGESVFDGAVQQIRERLAVQTGRDLLSDPTFSFSTLVGKETLDEAALADALVEQTDAITEAYGLFLNEHLLTTAGDAEVLRAALDDYLDAYRSDADGERAAFVGNLVIEDGLYPTTLVNSVSEAKADIAAGGTDEAKLKVKVIKEETYEQAIPFSTVEIPDETRLEDYRETTAAGAEGVASVTAQVTYIDGKETARQVLSSEVVTPPTDQQDVVGTMTMSQYEQQQALAAAQMADHTYSMNWPLGVANYISSYFGDGRGHKGYDIAAAAGSPILAAEAGEVVSMNACGSAYGLHFVVDHGNGLQTLYAHCSSVDVKVGQKVARGEVIAKVGRTGRATGNHLHFEVWEDGSRVNPGDYFN